MKTIATTAALLPLALVVSGAFAEAQAPPCGGFSFASGTDASGDLPHQASLCLGFQEEDFEGHADGASVGQLQLGPVMVDLNVVDEHGSQLADCASIYRFGRWPEAMLISLP